jgi:hypothetical protein
MREESHPFHPETAADPVTAGYLTLETAEMLLELYKTDMTSRYPFVVIPPETTADQLRQEKPFLMLSICAAASYNHELSLQRELGKEVKRQISSRTVLNGDMSFEMLQGILVHLAW